MELTAYLTFKGECEAAFELYRECLGAKPGPVFRYGDSPLASTVPADWQTKIMHASIEVGGQVLMGADIAPERYEEPKGFALSLQMTNAQQADAVFDALANGGRVLSPLEKTFWAERFGVVVDRFGVPWTINCEGSETAAP